MKPNSRLWIIAVILMISIIIALIFDTQKKQVVVANTPITIPSPYDMTEKPTVTPSTSSGKPTKSDLPFLATLAPESIPDLTHLNVVQLDVPLFTQQYIRSCEESSLRMVLAYYGIMTDDMSIVQKVGYAPHLWDHKNNIWDNPNEMFVGSIDDPNKNGYGTFAPAVASAANKFGRQAESDTNVSASFIGNQIASGYPVIIWGFFATPPFITYQWKTPAGSLVRAYRGEHVRVVTGLVGDPNNPTGFFVNDPLTGVKNEYWSAAVLMKHMNVWGALTNQVVVVK
jgi:uncharacterized protein YvpB